MLKMYYLCKEYLEDEFCIKSHLGLEIRKLAGKDSNEFEALINIFNKEKDHHYKLILGEILFDLGYRNFSSLKNLFKTKYRCDRYDAAALLIRSGDNSGEDIIRAEAKDIDSPVHPYTILADLKEGDNEYCKALYGELEQICVETFRKRKERLNKS